MIHARRSSRLSGAALSVLIIGSVGVLAPAAVPASPSAGTRPAAEVRPEAAAQPAAAGTILPAVADRTAESLTDALEALAAKTPSPDRPMMLEAFSAAGFAAESVEVSLDVTPTGLAVDSIRGAVTEDGSCLFGEVREGNVSVSILPVLASGYCFVGDQR
ncbi:hypothetical protein ABIB35_001165 [Arthrobacter sp. UYP6]|uniref:DUF6993 domain-containing protein n=1 Tax=Arthrobacter sp. UYP6 TaxID=1756378 RepID=UPI00339738D6